MQKKNLKNIVIALLLSSNLFYVIGCTNNIPNVIDSPSNSDNTSSQNNIKKTTLSFSKVTEEKYNELNNFMSRGLVPNSSGTNSAPNVSPTSAPSAAPTSASGDYSDSTSGSSDIIATPYPYPSPSAYSNYYPTPMATGYSYYGGSYFGGSFEDYVVSDFEEAKTSGYTGSYLSVIKDIINPILAGLPSDTRLISTYGNTDKNGITNTNIIPTAIPTYKPEPQNDSNVNEPRDIPTATPYSTYYSNPYQQWQFTYVSSAKKEIYSILVSSSEVLVLKQKWKLRELATNDIKIDSTKAIEIVENAIKNKDYSSPNSYSGPNYYGNNIEYLYEIPETATLSYSLAEEGKGQLVWNISISMNTYNPDYYYNQGYARVDAKTGDILYLERIGKVKNNYTYTTPTPQPYYSIMPSAQP